MEEDQNSQSSAAEPVEDGSKEDGSKAVATEQEPSSEAPPAADTPATEQDVAVDERRQYSRQELLAIAKALGDFPFPPSLDLQTSIELRDLDKRAPAQQGTAGEDIALKPAWARGGGRVGPPAPGLRSKLIDDSNQGENGDAKPVPPASKWRDDGHGPRDAKRGPPGFERGPQRTDDHHKERDKEGKGGDEVHTPRRLWADREQGGPPAGGRDAWRLERPPAGPNGAGNAGGAGGPREESRWRDDREGRPGGGGGGGGGAPPAARGPPGEGRVEAGRTQSSRFDTDWDSKRRHHEGEPGPWGGAPGRERGGRTTSMPPAMTMADVERERLAFREQARAGQNKQDHKSDLNALFQEEVDLNDLMDDEQKAAKGLLPPKPPQPQPRPGAEAGPPTPAIPPQGIKMSFMELAQAASKQGQKAGIETAASEGNQSNQSGKAMTLHDLEAQLTGATSIPEHAAGEGAGAGRPPRGPPPGIPVPVPVVNTAQQPQQQPGQQQAPQPSGSPLTMQANAQASQALMGLLKKGSAPSATAVPIAAPTPAESSATTPPPPAPSALAPAPSAPPVPAAPPATTGLGGLPFGGLGSILSSNQVPSDVLSAFGQAPTSTAASTQAQQLAAISAIWGAPAPSAVKPATEASKPSEATTQQPQQQAQQQYQAQPFGNKGLPAAGPQTGLPPRPQGGGASIMDLLARGAAKQQPPEPAPGAGVAPGMAALLNQLSRQQGQQQGHPQQQHLQPQQQQGPGQHATNALMEALKQMGINSSMAPPKPAAPVPGPSAFANGGRQGVGMGGQQPPGGDALSNLLAGLRTQPPPQPQQPQGRGAPDANAAILQQLLAGMQQGAYNQQQRQPNLPAQLYMQQQQQQQQPNMAALQNAGLTAQLLSQLQQGGHAGAGYGMQQQQAGLGRPGLQFPMQHAGIPIPQQVHNPLGMNQQQQQDSNFARLLAGQQALAQQQQALAQQLAQQQRPGGMGQPGGPSLADVERFLQQQQQRR